MKTYVLISWLMCLDTGIPWCGRRTQRASSLLITPDDPRGAIIRAQAFADYYDVRREDVRSVIFEEPVNLYVRLEVERAVENILRQGIKPGILAFDTLFHNSASADLKEPDVVLGLFRNMRWMTQEIGAHTPITTHHPPKDGKGLWGSIMIVGDVGVIHDFEKLAPDSTKLTCERMKLARIPDPMEVRTEFVQVETRCVEDDGEHKVGDLVMVEEMVVVVAEEPAEAPKDSSLEKVADILEVAVALYLRNSATHASVIAKTRELTPLKFNKKTGLMQPISERTADRALKLSIQRGHLNAPPKDTNSQGWLYSVIGGPAAIQPGKAGDGEVGAGGKSTATAGVLQTPAVVGSAFFNAKAPPSTAKPLTNDIGSGSSQGSVERKNSPGTDEEVGKKALGQLGTRRKMNGPEEGLG
jgi:hypothetical protein